MLPAENKAASEPTLAGEDPGSPKVAMLVQLEEELVDEPSPSPRLSNLPPYAPAEITRNIDSSGRSVVLRYQIPHSLSTFPSHLYNFPLTLTLHTLL